MHSLKVLTHWSYSFTCKLHHDCLSVISVHQMVPPLTEVADIQLQLTTHLSTPYSLEWTVCCKASCKLYPRLIYIAQNAGPPNRGALGLCMWVLPFRRPCILPRTFLHCDLWVYCHSITVTWLFLHKPETTGWLLSDVYNRCEHYILFTCWRSLGILFDCFVVIGIYAFY